MNKIFIIAGPTATGKTELGIKLAEKLNGEIVSADSRQVYKGMDIITGKDIPQTSEFRIRNSDLRLNNKNYDVGYRKKEGIPIWLVDAVDPDYSFNVSEYKESALKVISNIINRRKMPVIVGGTGFYIESVIKPMGNISVPPDYELRKNLSVKSVSDLGKMLEREDPYKWQNMNRSDRLNPRRLIRAIEIAGSSINSRQENKDIYFDVCVIFLKGQNIKLFERIDKRVDSRVKKGAIDEVQKLRKRFDFSHPAFSSSGYREIEQHLAGKITLDEAVQKWKFKEHALARRQQTYFNKMASNLLSAGKKVQITDYREEGIPQSVEENISTWYNSK